SEEHTSELQSLTNLVCRLLLEKKKNCRRDRRDEHVGVLRKRTPKRKPAIDCRHKLIIFKSSAPEYQFHIDARIGSLQRVKFAHDGQPFRFDRTYPILAFDYDGNSIIRESHGNMRESGNRIEEVMQCRFENRDVKAHAQMIRQR